MPIDRCVICCLRSKLRESYLSGICSAIDLIRLGEDLPGDSSDLVGQCDNHLIAVHALFKPGDPCAQRMTLPVAGLHAGSGSMNQYPSKIGIPSLTDAEQSCLSAGGVLSWSESKPRCEEPPVGELVTVTG